MTTYIILRQIEVSGEGDGARGWVEARRMEARSDTSAIRQHGADGGVYVAVPARSWRPRTVKAEQSVRLTIT